MNDYIKREDAIKNIKPMVGIWADDGRFYVDYQRVLDIINNEPSADVVEVVRCRDCEHWECNPGTDRYGSCKKVAYDDFEVVMEGDDFCSYGKRKEQENNDV